MEEDICSLPPVVMFTLVAIPTVPLMIFFEIRLLLAKDPDEVWPTTGRACSFNFTLWAILMGAYYFITRGSWSVTVLPILMAVTLFIFVLAGGFVTGIYMNRDTSLILRIKKYRERYNSVQVPYCKPMKKYWKFALFVLLLLLIRACGLQIEVPHWGKVVDAETNEPLSDVAVNLRLYYDCPRPPAGGPSGTLSDKETLTGENGEYFLPFSFNTMKPICFTRKMFAFLKPGYFAAGSENASETKLYKMTHFLNVRKYWDQSQYPTSEYLPEDSRHWNNAVYKMKNVEFDATGEKGIFFQLPGRKFIRIHARKSKYIASKLEPRTISQNIYYVYDDISKDWLILDGRGQNISVEGPALPEYDFISTDLMWSWPIYADSDSLFYPVEENPIPDGMQYKKGEIKRIKAEWGDISALAGTVSSSFTIEDNESKLCHYGTSSTEKSFYGVPTENDRYNSYSLRCFTAKDLPNLSDSDDSNSVRFKYLAQSRMDLGVVVVVKTAHYWRIYMFSSKYDRKLRKRVPTFQQYSLLFSSKKDMTAFTNDGNIFYIAFKNKGIRKYDWTGGSIIENRGRRRNSWFSDSRDNLELPFNRYSRKAAYGDAISLVSAHAVNDVAVYAVSGDDKIYRFGSDGVPDFQINIKER